MPMFGPGFSVGLMLCPAYAQIPDVATARSTAIKHGPVPANASLAMPGMDMSMDMPMPGAVGQLTDEDARTQGDDNVPAPGSGNGIHHQYDSLYHYLANALVAAVPMWLVPAATEPMATTVGLAAPQVAYFQISPRAQSARAPPPVV